MALNRERPRPVLLGRVRFPPGRLTRQRNHRPVCPPGVSLRAATRGVGRHPRPPARRQGRNRRALAPRRLHDRLERRRRCWPGGGPRAPSCRTALRRRAVRRAGHRLGHQAMPATKETSPKMVNASPKVSRTSTAPATTRRTSTRHRTSAAARCCPPLHLHSVRPGAQSVGVCRRGRPVVALGVRQLGACKEPRQSIYCALGREPLSYKGNPCRSTFSRRKILRK